MKSYKNDLNTEFAKEKVNRSNFIKNNQLKVEKNGQKQE